MKYQRTEKKKRGVNRLSSIILCSEMLILFVICICLLNINSSDEEYSNRRTKVGHFFKPIQLFRIGEEQIPVGEARILDRNRERIGLTIGRLREQYSCYNKSGILVKNIFIESRDTRLLVEEVEESYSDYYFELEVDARVENEMLNNLLDSLKNYSQKEIELVVWSSENKRSTKILPDDFEF